jgi:hypothetical protein
VGVVMLERRIVAGLDEDRIDSSRPTLRNPVEAGRLPPLPNAG